MPNVAAVRRAVSEEIGDRRERTELFYSIRYGRFPKSDRQLWIVATYVCRRHAAVWILSVVCSNSACSKHQQLHQSSHILDPIKQASTKSRQDGVPVVFGCLTTTSNTLITTADRRLLFHSGPFCLWSRHLHRLQPVHADTLTTYCVMMFCCASSAMLDPSLHTVSHTSEVCGRTGALSAGLWKWHAGRPFCPPDASTPVGSKCGGLTDLGIQSYPWWCTALPRSADPCWRLARTMITFAEPISVTSWYRQSNCQQSAAKPLRLRLNTSGTDCHLTSSLSTFRHLLKRFYLGNHILTSSANIFSSVALQWLCHLGH